MAVTASPCLANVGEGDRVPRVGATASANAREPEEASVEAWARARGLRYLPRRGAPFSALWGGQALDELVVRSVDGRLAAYRRGVPEPLSHHPGSAMLRVKTLLQGGRDKLVDASGARPGDSVLDLTAGLGSDAAVLAHAVGRGGRVAALEGSYTVALLLDCARTRPDPDLPIPLREALARVEVWWGEAAEALRALPAGSFDIVYADPMFERAIERSVGIRALRPFAARTGLTRDDLLQAVRVARRRVVVKDRRDGRLLRQLGLEAGTGRTGSTVYAWVDSN